MKCKIVESNTEMPKEQLRGLMLLMVDGLRQFLATPEGKQDFENWKREREEKERRYEAEKAHHTAEEGTV